MSLDNYDATTALSAYYPTRDERRPARLWATEKLLHDMAALGMVEFFEGPGTDPTMLDGYATTKIWLLVSSGVTPVPGEVRAYDGMGDPTLVASWPLLDRAGFLAFLGVRLDLGKFETRADVVVATISPNVNGITILGYTAVGDGGAASYKRVLTEPSHDGKIQSADGAWWEIITYDQARFETVADVAAARVPAGLSVLETLGNAVAGDGGHGLYKRVAVEPPAGGKVQSADGAWWKLVESAAAGTSDSFATKAEAEAATLDVAPPSIRIEGYAAAGDGGGALYRNVVSEPSHPGKISITLNDGVTVAWYEIAEETLSPEMFGAVGADDTAALQSALTALNGRTLVLDGSKTYICTSALQMSANTTIDFNGATLDFSTMTSDVGGIKLCMYAEGSGAVASELLTADTNEGSLTATVANGATFAPGDWVQLRATDFYIYDGSTNVPKGEIIQVLSVSGNTVTLRTPALDTYTVANSASLHKLSFLENIHLHRPKLVGSGIEGDVMEGIRLSWVKDFTVRDGDFRYIDLRALHLLNSILGDVDGGYFEGVRYTGVGSICYAVTLNNCAQWITIRGVKAQQVRHLFVCSASAAQFGQPLFITVSDCHAFNMMSGGVYASYAYEHHGFGRFILFNNCTANGFHSGARVEGSDVTISNCVFRNCRLYGVSIGDGRAIKNVVISNVRVSFQTSELTVARAGFAFYPGGNANANAENIVVNGLHVDGFQDTVNGAGNGVRFWSVASTKNIVLRDVTVFSPVSAHNGDYGFYIDAPNVEMYNCRVHNFPRAFRILESGANASIINPVVTNDAVVGTAPAFQLSSADTLVRSPIIRTAYRAFVIDASATNALIAHKSVRGVGNADTNAGTGTVTTDAAST